MIIKAKYKGYCRICHKVIPSKTKIWWTKQEGTYHIKCIRKNGLPKLTPEEQEEHIRRANKKKEQKRQVNLIVAQHIELNRKRQIEQNVMKSHIRWTERQVKARARIEKGISPPPINWRALTREEQWQQTYGVNNAK